MTKRKPTKRKPKTPRPDPLRAWLATWAQAAGETTAIWAIRLLALCLLPLRLALSLTALAITSFAKAAWQELKLVRQGDVEKFSKPRGLQTRVSGARILGKGNVSTGDVPHE